MSSFLPDSSPLATANNDDADDADDANDGDDEDDGDDYDDDDDDDDGSTKHNGFSCDACKKEPICSDRYRCLQCENFDLCAKCFERRREPLEHKSGHSLVHFRLPKEIFGRTVNTDDVTLEKLKQSYGNEKNAWVTCAGCKKQNFIGLRFKCDSCKAYDLCEKCATKGVTTKDHKSNHPLILTSHRVIVVIPVSDIKLEEKLGSGAFSKYLLLFPNIVHLTFFKALSTRLDGYQKTLR
jgi:hypothetical protein